MSWFRLNYFQPRATCFYELGLKRTGCNPNAYFIMTLNTGRIPDFGDLPPFDEIIVISQKGVGLTGQIPLAKTIMLKLSVGYNHQIIHPSETVRNITDGSLGLVWLF